MEKVKESFTKFIDIDDKNIIDAAWQVLQNKLNAYFERRKDAKTFQDEIYKWRLLSHYAGTVFDNAEKLKTWLQDSDNNLLSSRNFGSTYDGIIRGERNVQSLIKDGFQLFSSIDNYQLIRDNPLFQWKNQKGENKTISDRDIATYLFLQNPLQYMPYPSDVFAKAAKDIGLNGMTMPRWMEFGRLVILPLLAEKFNVTPLVDIYPIKNLDVDRDFIDIQNGKYLCMLDAQDFVYISWRYDASERHYWSGGCSWGEESKVKEFIDGNYWQIGWHHDEKNKGAKQAWNNLKKVRVGDYMSFHGYGGRNNLKIYYLAEIINKNEADGKLFLRALDKIPFYQGKAPKLASGTWFGTLFPVTGTTAIQTIFGDNDNSQQEHEMNELNPLEKSNLALLKSVRQIIFTGAPGTGKTYMAKQLAYALSGDDEKNHPHVEFCQFHPSLDYTDFVEGLRPIISSMDNNEISFERKDGIFKSFCKIALKNYIDAQKTQKEIEVDISTGDKINTFLSDAIESETSFKTTNGNTFFIREFDDRRISVEIPQNEKTSKIIVPYQEIQRIIADNCTLTKPRDIKDIFKRQHNRQQDSYVYIICQEIRKLKKEQKSEVKNTIKLQNYVFIIDEINRGDISKIFGELFYAIDPGYRGNKGKITTQYANLLDDTDLYKDGFFIPENVYIIGTMNDIDRSVESMDFAIRRRFTWVDIKAEDATGMWNKTIPDYREDAIGAMIRINKLISDIQGLGDAFHIGPAYFLKLAEYEGDMGKLWTLHIMPLLKEYLRGMPMAEDSLASLKQAYFDQTEQTAGE